MRKIKPITIRNIYIVGILIGLIILVFSLYYPWGWYTTSTIHDGSSGGRSINDLNGFSALFLGGYFGIICMIISIGYVYSWNARKTTLTNIIGDICFVINFILWPIIAPILFVPSNGNYIGVAGGYLLGLLSLVIFFLALLLLIENRKTLQTEKVVITETKKVLENVDKEETKTCPSCGAEITDPTNTFCNKCGAPLK